MPGTPIAKAPAAPNSHNPTPSVQPPGKHRQMTYTDIYCRFDFRRISKFDYLKFITIRTFYRPIWQ